LTNPVPLTVSVKAAPPTRPPAGESVVIPGIGLFTAKFMAVVVPPPGAGFVTVTGNDPAVAMSAAEMAAVNCVPLTTVVVFAAPLKLTTEFATKFVPVTVNVNAAPPAVPLVGAMEVNVGTGFGALEILNTKFAVVPPPGAAFVTVTLALPEVVISDAKIAAVSCVALTNVVVFALPLNFTTDVETKFVPFTVSVNAAPPATTPVGLSDAIVGTGLLMVKATPAEVPPPGAGFVTVTEGVPAAATSAAVMAAVSCVELTNVVARAAPLKLTTEAASKFVPFTVNVNAALPAIALVGESVVIVGAGLFTAKLTAAEVPPPGAGFTTVTGKLPAVAISAAGIAAVNCVALTNVVAAAIPRNVTLDVLT